MALYDWQPFIFGLYCSNVAARASVVVRRDVWFPGDPVGLQSLSHASHPDFLVKLSRKRPSHAARCRVLFQVGLYSASRTPGGNHRGGAGAAHRNGGGAESRALQSWAAGGACRAGDAFSDSFVRESSEDHREDLLVCKWEL